MLKFNSSESLHPAFAPPCEPYTAEQLEQEFIAEVGRWSDGPIWDECGEELPLRMFFRDRIKRILRLVKSEHQDQTRWETGLDGQPLPYTVHLLGAALRALRGGEEGLVVCGVLTHDLLEDTRLRHLSESVLNQIFQSEGLTYLNQLLSKVHFDEQVYGAGEHYTDTAYYSDLGADVKALRIKGWERQDNLASFGRLLTSLSPQKLRERRVLIRSEHNANDTLGHLLPLFRSAIDHTSGKDLKLLIKIKADLTETTRALISQIGLTRLDLTNIS